MALDATVLAGLYRAKMVAKFTLAGIPIQDGPALQLMAEALAESVVEHVTIAATVVGTATGALGGGPGVPVAGTIT